MSINIDSFGPHTASLCTEQYRKLSKKGKPQASREWTVLSCFVETRTPSTGTGDYEASVICLATGTKCLGGKERSCKGDKVNDSHAEVLARRLLLRYFYMQLMNMFDGKASVFNHSSNGDISLKESVQYHMYISHTPCGDASIIPKDDAPDCKHTRNIDTSIKLSSENESRKRHLSPLEETGLSKSSKRNRTKSIDSSYCEVDEVKSHLVEKAVSYDGAYSMDTGLPPMQSLDRASVDYASSLGAPSTEKNSFPCYDNDIHRTGAKCVPSGIQDPFRSGEEYHVVSALRIKPGRGDRTMSMSCSDKIMKWCTLGLQGSLLSHFISGPIVLSSLVFGKCPFSVDSVDRAISLRSRDADGLTRGDLVYHYHKPRVLLTDNIFEHCKMSIENGKDSNCKGKIGPSGSAILWCKTPEIHEVCCNGKRQGVTKSKSEKPEARISVCKLELFNCFVTTAEKFHQNLAEDNKKIEFQGMTYGKLKTGNPSYWKAKCAFFDVFHDWIRKPVEEEFFTLDSYG